MTTSTTRTYRHEPAGHDTTQVYYVETVCTETRLWLGTAHSKQEQLAIEDAHKARQETEQ